MAIIDDIMNGVASGGEVHVEADRAKAIELALNEAEEGDVVLICGKGHETTQEIKDVKYPFNDCEVARNFTNKRKKMI
jgi:UDP-N-acetylmuramoyl-L-alanyl-D-glutamate--2,6-diaminopimelate ligase